MVKLLLLFLVLWIKIDDVGFLYFDVIKDIVVGWKLVGIG